MRGYCYFLVCDIAELWSGGRFSSFFFFDGEQKQWPRLRLLAAAIPRIQFYSNARHARQKLNYIVRCPEEMAHGFWGGFYPAELLSRCSAVPPRYKYRHQRGLAARKKGMRKEPVLDRGERRRKERCQTVSWTRTWFFIPSFFIRKMEFHELWSQHSYGLSLWIIAFVRPVVALFFELKITRCCAGSVRRSIFFVE